MVIIKANFVGNYQLCRNIIYNLEILEVLYKNESSLLNKPIILFNVSIIEALMHDFHVKAKYYTSEGIRNVSDKILTYMRSKRKIDKLRLYIDSARKHDIFEVKGGKLYDELETLRKLRNRIHIQNVGKELEGNEEKVFTKEYKILSEKSLEKMMRFMSSKHSRDKGLHFDGVFRLPWSPHYSEEFKA